MVFAFSLTSVLQLIMLIMELHHKIGDLKDEYLMLNSLKIAISSLCAGIAAYVTLYIVAPLVNMQTYWGILIQGTTSAIIGVVVYLLVCWMLKVDESDHWIRLVKQAFSKSIKPFSVITNIWN